MLHRFPVLTLALLFLVLLGAARLPGPALATTLMDKEFTCALCGKTFTDKVLGSTNVVERDAEFRPYARGLEPLPYFIHACPHCGFTDGDHRLKLSDQEQAEIKKFLAAYGQQHSLSQLSPGEKYEIFARTQEIRRLPPLTIALQYRYAAWMADDAGQAAAARDCREQAIRLLSLALENQQVPAKEVPVVTYLVGELHRRLGDFPVALNWFGRVQDPDPPLAKILAQQQGLAQKKDAAKAMLPPLK